MKRIDLTGQRFRKLTVIGYDHSYKNGEAIWKCRCDCGNMTYVISGNLRRGNTKSCGCYGRECTAERNTTHGKTKERLHGVWTRMKDRCNNPKSDRWEWYGARGISVCEEWKNSYEAFREWALSNGYQGGLTIDRVDVNGNYCPDNCRWITIKDQQNNRRNNHRITVGEETHTIAEWSKITGIRQGTIYARIASGWSAEDAITTPERKSS